MSSSTTVLRPSTAVPAPTSMASINGSVPASTSPPASVGQGSATSTPTSIATHSATSADSSSPSIHEPTTSASPSRTQSLTSTTGSQSSISSSSNPTSRHSPSPLPDHRLSNGTVAGIVVGAALALGLITFLATFAIMRRQKQSKSKRRSRSSEDGRGVALGPPRHQGSTGASRTHDSYLPQSADDKTIQQKVRSTLDQIELHVENFYRNSSSSALLPDSGELSAFDSPYLSASLASLLPHSRNKLSIIKHALVQSVSSSLSLTADPTRSLIPTEYTLLPSTITSTKSSVTSKPDFTQVMSRWRVATAYLHPDPTKDQNYISKRDRQISIIVQSFARAFAPWKSTGYKDEERARSLSAILEEAANLGIFLFSQPSTLNFYWPAAGEIRSGKVVVSPGLVKTADENGRKLAEAWIMVDQVVEDV